LRNVITLKPTCSTDSCNYIALGQIIMVSKSCAKWLLLHHGTDMVRSTELAHWPSGRPQGGIQGDGTSC
jgi:hypothetical protein